MGFIDKNPPNKRSECLRLHQLIDPISTHHLRAHDRHRHSTLVCKLLEQVTTGQRSGRYADSIFGNGLCVKAILASLFSLRGC